MLRIFLTLLLLWSAHAHGQFELADPALAKCVNKLAAKKGWESADQVLEIVCHNRKVQSAVGIEQFPNLNRLSLYKNNLRSIELIPFTQLKHLNIAGNQIPALTISNHPLLEKLFIFHNPLTSLEIAECENLNTLKANNGQLTEITFRATPALEKIYLFDNQLEIIDIDDLTRLRYLDVRHNPMPDEFYDFLDGLSDLTSLHDGNAEDWE